MTIYEPKSNEEEISSCFKAAIEKLDRVEADAEKKKTQIVKDLAKDLEGKIATDSICNEIVHRLHGKKISPRTIRKCLDKKYKEKHRVENALKQKGHENTKDLAALVPLEQEKPKQQIAATQGGKSIIINNTETCSTNSDYVGHPYDPLAQNQIGIDDSNKTQTIQTNQGKLDEPKANIETSTIDNYSPSATVEKITSDGSDKQVCSHQITREKYRVVRDAMDKSEGSILVKFDRLICLLIQPLFVKYLEQRNIFVVGKYRL
jgi:hypothetical protein